MEVTRFRRVMENLTIFGTVVVAALIWAIPVFLFYFLRAPWVIQRETDERERNTRAAYEEALAKQILNLAQLEVRFEKREPYILDRGSIRQYRIGVYNYGPRVADNVKVWLKQIEPKPRCSVRGDFPYRVPKADAQVTSRNIEIQDARINLAKKSFLQFFQHG